MIISIIIWIIFNVLYYKLNVYKDTDFIWLSGFLCVITGIIETLHYINIQF